MIALGLFAKKVKTFQGPRQIQRLLRKIWHIKVIHWDVTEVFYPGRAFIIAFKSWFLYQVLVHQETKNRKKSYSTYLLLCFTRFHYRYPIKQVIMILSGSVSYYLQVEEDLLLNNLLFRRVNLLGHGNYTLDLTWSVFLFKFALLIHILLPLEESSSFHIYIFLFGE